ncbi:MAG: gamma-glutamyltransferase [Caulobacteraceae bacterium]|nr:gamma-glutamyltransferase [Caulobacteraceae bacterium]
MVTWKRATAVFAAALLLLAGAPAAAQQRLLEYPSIHHPAITQHGMVVSQNAIATEAGVEMLQKGGNAVDAAVATAFALAVTLPRAGNLGGDGFMLVHLAKTGETLFIDYRSIAPRAARIEDFVGPDGKELKLASEGYRAPAVPGTVAGLELAHRKWGRLPWKTVLAPAIRLAEKGVVLSPDEAFVFTWGRDRLSQSEPAKAAFYHRDGSLYGAGETLRQPDLAWTLRQVSRGGARAFYEGPVAERLVADLQAHGGLITMQDMAAYRAVERKPLVGSYRGLTVVTAPPASAGGASLLQMLNILERFDMKAARQGSARSTHLIAETLKLGTADRYRYLGDTGFVKVPLAGFTSKAYAAERARLIDPDHAKPAKAFGVGDPWAYESPNTTHLSVADAEGNAVSNTFTLGADFGSGVMARGTGFLLNNQMNNFSHEQVVEARERGEPPPANGMAPGKRMLSTMMPTMIFKDGKPWMIAGTPGGGAIVSAMLQLIVNVVDYDLNIAEATHRPRIHQDTGEFLQVEPGFNPDTADRLVEMGHKLRPRQTIGSTQSIIVQDGLFLGAPDPRRPGAEAAGP